MDAGAKSRALRDLTDLPLSEDGEGQAVPHMHAAHEVRVLEPLVVAEDTRAVICHGLPSDLVSDQGED